MFLQLPFDTIYQSHDANEKFKDIDLMQLHSTLELTHSQKEKNYSLI